MAKSTKMHILKCFSDLLENNELDKITVTMLVEKCQISRQTFYYHFADIQSLIDWGVKQSTLGCVNKAKSANNIKEATVIFLEQSLKNKRFLKKCFSSSLSGYMLLIMKQSIIEYSSEFFNRFIPPNYPLIDDVKFIIEFVSDGVTGYILTMINSNEEPNIEQIANKMNMLIFKRLSENVVM